MNCLKCNSTNLVRRLVHGTGEVVATMVCECGAVHLKTRQGLVLQDGSAVVQKTVAETGAPIKTDAFKTVEEVFNASQLKALIKDEVILESGKTDPAKEIVEGVYLIQRSDTAQFVTVRISTRGKVLGVMVE